jgi:hypothetical protein
MKEKKRSCVSKKKIWNVKRCLLEAGNTPRRPQPVSLAELTSRARTLWESLQQHTPFPADEREPGVMMCIIYVYT